MPKEFFQIASHGRWTEALRGKIEVSGNSKVFGEGDTLASYTRDNAWVEFNETRKGMLKQGFMADVVMVDTSLFDLASEHFAMIWASVTICDGVVTHDA